MVIRKRAIWTGGVIGFLLCVTVHCTFYLGFGEEYYRCENGTDCPYGDCVCQEGEGCVPRKEGDAKACWPCLEDSECQGESTCMVGACQEGHCLIVPAQNGTECDDLDPCTIGDHCKDGICKSGVTRTEGWGSGDTCENGIDDDCDGYMDLADPDCPPCSGNGDCPDDANPCTQESCVDGACRRTQLSTPCDDGDLCTKEDTCHQGRCQGVTYSCDDLDPLTVDTCLGDGNCVHTGTPDCLSPLATVTPAYRGLGQSIAVEGNYVYLGVAEGQRGVQVIDMSDPLNPQEQGFVDLGAVSTGGDCSVLGLDVYQGMVYAAAYNCGLWIVNATDPANPVVVMNLSQSSETWGAHLAGFPLLYVASHGAVSAVDIQDPYAPAVKSSLDLTDNTQDVHAVGNRLYAASRGWFQVVDITDPANPVLLGEVDGVHWAYEVWAKDNSFAYVVTKVSRTLLVIDVRDDAHPEVRWTSDVGEADYRGIDGEGDRIYVSTGLGEYSPTRSGSIRVYSIQTPEAPRFLGETRTSHALYEVRVKDGKVYASMEEGSMKAYEDMFDCQ